MSESNWGANREHKCAGSAIFLPAGLQSLGDGPARNGRICDFTENLGALPSKFLESGRKK